MKEKVEYRLQEHMDVFSNMQGDEELLCKIQRVAEEIVQCLRNGGRILLCGNGGSASDAQHIAAEFVGRFQKTRTPYDAEALNINVSSLTAISNDYGYDEVFARQVEAKGRPGDILIGFSTSGTSANVVHALKRGKQIGMKTILFTGNHELKELQEDCNEILRIPSTLAARIQEGHIWVGHMIAELVEDELSQ